MFNFYMPWKLGKNFLTFSGRTEMEHWAKYGNKTYGERIHHVLAISDIFELNGLIFLFLIKT